MTIGAKKNVAWVLAILGFGATYFFVLVCAIERPPNDTTLYLWPAIGSILPFVSFVKLRSYYRLEPPPPPGAFRLQLTDLIALSISFAAVMSILKAFWSDEKFPRVGPLIAFGVLALWTGGMIAASLRAIFMGIQRYSFAFFHALRTFGWMTLGAIFAVLIYIALDDGLLRTFRFLYEIAVPNNSTRSDSFLFWYLRAGIPAWLIGTVFLRRYERLSVSAE